MPEFGLGRMPAEDERDRLFSVAPLLPAEAPERTYRYWYANGWWGDQGARPWCVEYAWHHYVADSPYTHYPADPPFWGIGSVYHEAQTIDEWPGTSYDGTSIRAGAKVLQRLGYISQYRWAFNIEDIIHSVLTVAPVVLGTNWYEDMFNPYEDGFIEVGGRIAGGHAYILNGVNTKREIFRIKNSWGRGWGKNGHAYISFEDVMRLFNQDGEACIAIENP